MFPDAESQNLAPLCSLDAHAHFAPTRTAEELRGAGAVLAMTLSVEEATTRPQMPGLPIAWGVGCHPRRKRAQEEFDPERFGLLAEQSAVVREIGLDVRCSQVQLETQLRTLRQALSILSRLPRLVSLHSYAATSLVLQELQRTPIAVPIFHWWTGTIAETREAVALGGYFSVHSAVARQSKFKTAIPPERLLVESDHGWSDPPVAIPCRVEWVEHLMAGHLRCSQGEVRNLVWRNFTRAIRETGSESLLPPTLRALLPW